MNIAAKLIVVLGLVAIGAFAVVLALPHRPPTEARVTTLDGRTVPIAELRGKVTVVNFWATWCGVCIREMPRIVEAHRRYAPRGYETVAVAVRDRKESVAEFARQHALPFKVALDTGEASERFGNVRITPTTFVIGRDGRVIRRFVGEPDWKQFDAVVEKALTD
ncbi:MAG TPA: TlpA disulfide reductase family protein [Burkholderiales bacterium]|nr:TlpA disulfide reductase family protein [Burkholderiales bacterium]